MSLTMEQKKERSQDANVRFITGRIVNKDSGKPYVFISYKSDDWKIVLQDVVYRLVKDYGLNVYFDGDFDGHSPLWTKQFPANMESESCKGVIAFIDDGYATSYATLLELMYSQGGCQNKKNAYEFVRKDVVPIFLREGLHIIQDESDTGLGRDGYEDGSMNLHAKDEKELFNDTFKHCSDIFEKSQKPYKREEHLSKQLCSVMVAELISHIGKNDIIYHAGDSLESIVSTIKDAFGEEVFSGQSSESVTPMQTQTAEPDETQTSVGGFVYELWGESHTSRNLAALMHEVFDLIAAKHPDKISEIARDASITSVARKEAVDHKELPANKSSYFRAKKEHEVNGGLYYVGTSYNREQGIGQLQRILEKCEGKSDSLKVLSYPQKASHSKKSGKAGIGEFHEGM